MVFIIHETWNFILKANTLMNKLEWGENQRIQNNSLHAGWGNTSKDEHQREDNNRLWLVNF